MGFRDEAGAKQLAQRRGIDRIGLDLRVGDGLQELRMGQVEINPLGNQPRAEPVPPPGGFNHRLMGSRKLAEVAASRRGIVGEGGLAHPVTTGREGGQRGAQSMLVDSSVDHACSKRRSYSLTTIPLGNIKCLESAEAAEDLEARLASRERPRSSSIGRYAASPGSSRWRLRPPLD